MKTFEEKWTAWLDGQLTGKELAEFEASLPDISAARLEKQEAGRLRGLLRQALSTHAMANEEFFSHQLREEIERDTRAAAPQSTPAPVRESWWSIGRVVWTGAASLAVMTLTTFFMMREDNVGGQSTYLTQIINARVDPAVSPNATISMFETKDEEKVTVLWVDGLQTLPPEYAAK